MDALLASQVEYYRAHATHYDDWWFRWDRHDLGEEFRARWEADIAQARGALDAFAPGGDVLELAGGTGNWTAELARHADHLTVVDVSPEVFEVARPKLAGTAVPVDWIVADVFSWRPPRRFDVVFFSFWLSHVPDQLFPPFWALVDGALAPDGRVFFIDNAHPDRGPPSVQRRFRRDGPRYEGIDSLTDTALGVSWRRTRDGREFPIVKVWWEPEPLRARLAELGWDVEISTTDWAFLHGRGRRRVPSRLR